MGAFDPHLHGDRPPDIGFSLLALTGGRYIAATEPYRRFGGLDMAESLKRNPLALFKEWKTETIIALYEFLRERLGGEREQIEGINLLLFAST